MKNELKEKFLQSIKKRFNRNVQDNNLPFTAVFHFDKNLRFLFFEGTLFQFPGITAQEIVGKTLFEVIIFHAELIPYINIFKNALGESISKQIISLSGHDIETVSIPVKNDEKEIIAGIVMIYDKTAVDKKQLDNMNTNLFLNQTIDSIPIGIAILDQDCNISKVNITFAKIFEFQKRKDCYRFQFLDLFYDPQESKNILNLIKQGTFTDCETKLIRCDGSVFWGVINECKVTNNFGKIQYICTFQDITEKKFTEERYSISKERTEKIIHIATQLNSQLDMNSVVNIVCDESIRVFPNSQVWINLVDEKGRGLIQMVSPDSINGSQPNSILQQHVFKDELEILVRENEEKENHGILHSTQKIRIYPIDEKMMVIITPIIRDLKLMGFLNVGVREKKPHITNNDLQVLSGLSNLASQAFQNARLFEEAKRQRDELESLFKITRDLSVNQDFQDLLKIILDTSQALIGTHCGAICLYDEEHHKFKIVTTNNFPISVGTSFSTRDHFFDNIVFSFGPQVIIDYQNYPYQLSGLEHLNISTCILHPMVYYGQLVGVIIMTSDENPSPEFSAKELKLLSLFANQAAGVVYSAKLYREVQEQASRLTCMYDAGIAVNSVLDLHTQLDFLLNIAVNMLHADRGIYFKYAKAQESLIPEVILGFDNQTNEYLKSMVYPITSEKDIYGWVCENKLPRVVDNVIEEQGYLEVDANIKSALYIPILHAEKFLGLINIMSTKSAAFTKHDERLMVQLSNQIAVALEKGELFQEMEKNIVIGKALNSVERAISSNLDINIIFNLIIDLVQSTIHTDLVRILLLKKSMQTLQVSLEKSLHPNFSSNQSAIHIADELTGRALNERVNVICYDLQQNKNLPEEYSLFKKEGFRTYYAIPLISNGKTKGVIELFDRELNPDIGDNEEIFDSIAIQAAIAIENADRANEVHRKNNELYNATNSIIEGWAYSLELNNRDTRGNLKNLAKKTEHIARLMNVDDSELESIYNGALLHDLGSLMIPDQIYFKKSKLTLDEWTIVKEHPAKAKDLLQTIPFLKGTLDIVYSHHERWDGSGYPQALQGEKIPLNARIFAVVDVWNALSSDRPFRSAWPQDKIRRYLYNNAGKLFDPQVVKRSLNNL